MLPRRDLQQKYLRLSVLLDANPNKATQTSERMQALSQNLRQEDGYGG